MSDDQQFDYVENGLPDGSTVGARGYIRDPGRSAGLCLHLLKGACMVSGGPGVPTPCASITVPCYDFEQVLVYRNAFGDGRLRSES